MNRLWLWIAASFALGIALARVDTLPIMLFALSLIMLALMLAVAPFRFAYRQQWSLALAFLGMGCLYAELLRPTPAFDPLYTWCQKQALAGEELAQLPPVALEGVIQQADLIQSDTTYATFVLLADTFAARGETHPIHSRVVLQWSNPKRPLYPGQRVRVEGVLENRLGPFNFGIQGIENYYHHRGIYTSLTLPFWSNPEVLSTNKWSPGYWIAQLREAEAGALRKAIPENAIPFVNTVWMGERRGISNEEYEKFLLTGTAHILAVSGVHVGIIFFSLTFLLGNNIQNRKWRIALIIMAVWLFALLAGARVSSVRAATMITLFLAAELFNRETDAPTTLGQSAFFFLLLQPYLLFDMGFLLSFGSVASLLLFVPIFTESLSPSPWWLRNNLPPVLAVQILPFPLVSSFFNVLPLFGPLLNLLVLPLLGVVLWLCLITSLCALLIPPVAPLFGHALQPVVLFIELLTHYAAQMPGAYLRLTSPTPWAIALYWLGVLAFAWAMLAVRKKYRLVALGACCLILCAMLWQPFQRPGVDFLDVGHGDAAFVRTPGGTTILIDGGDRSEYADYGQRVVAPFLYRHGVTRLDYLVMTHSDRDHVGGLLHTLESVPVGMAILPTVQSGTELEAEFLALCAKRGVPIQRCAKGDIIKAAGASIEVLAPDPQHVFTDVNNNSLVLRVRWPGLEVLFTGDIETEAEQLLAREDCQSQILKVPHHGSHTSSSQQFLDAVQPSIAVVSTFGGGRRRAVHPEVNARYMDMGVPLFRTDLSGGVRIYQDENKLFFLGARKHHGQTDKEVPTAP